MISKFSSSHTVYWTCQPVSPVSTYELDPDMYMAQHMFNCILLPTHSGSCPLWGSRSPYIPITDQINVPIFLSAEGNHCKGTDPSENRALIAVPLKPNVIETDKTQPKVQQEKNLGQCICSIQQRMQTEKRLYLELIDKINRRI